MTSLLPRHPDILKGGGHGDDGDGGDHGDDGDGSGHGDDGDGGGHGVEEGLKCLDLVCKKVRDDLQADLVDSKEKNVKDRATSGKSYRVVCQKYAVDTAELTTKLKASQAETAEWKISHSVLKTRVDKADQKVYDDVDARGVRVVKKAMQKVKIGVDTCIRVAYFRTHGNLMVLNDVYEQAFEDVSEASTMDQIEKVWDRPLPAHITDDEELKEKLAAAGLSMNDRKVRLDKKAAGKKAADLEQSS